MCRKHVEDIERAQLPFTSADVAGELVRWLSYLGAERRMSPKTCEAYGRDVRQFLAFLSEHRPAGEPRGAGPAGAGRRARLHGGARGDGIGSRSLMRTLAGVRSFARFLERTGKGRIGALAAVRAPKLAKTLPKPIAISAAKRITETDLRAGEARAVVLARDAAVLALLYGSGLRISEALGLKRKAFPARGRGDVITVTGKGNKTRMVPVLAQVADLIAEYAALCPYELPADGPLFVGAKEARSRRASSSSPWRGCAARSACRRPRRRMRCAFLRHPSLGARRRPRASRSCSATPRCRRRRSTAVDTERLLEAYRNAHPRA